MTFHFSETGGNVRLEYSGTLNLAGLSYIDGLTSVEEHRLRLLTPINGTSYNAIIQLGDGTQLRTFTSAFSSAPGVYYIGSALVATSYGGNAIVLPTSSLAQNATLRFAQSDIVNDAWTGSGFMQWDGTTFAAWGIDTATKTWVLNNAAANKIIMTFGSAPVATVPEPSSMTWLSTAAIGLLTWRSRRKA
ncbi:hypothetical protein F183_A50250 [Bryobacterales bacterium F-183]|nr:hypothetical protein F183_A50250 [Bryobacterales bacterium F-183]